MNNKITCANIRNALQSGAQLIDVRSPKEFGQFALPTAINMHIDQLADYLPIINGEITHLIYCGTGIRSKIATQYLHDNGISTAIDIGAFTNYQACFN